MLSIFNQQILICTSSVTPNKTLRNVLRGITLQYKNSRLLLQFLGLKLEQFQFSKNLALISANKSFSRKQLHSFMGCPPLAYGNQQMRLG